MTKFEESLRELVREELKGNEPAPAPNSGEIFWLFLCVANVAMLLWLLPETVFANQRVQSLSKFVVWLGGSIFISSFIWFRERLLVLSRNQIFKVIQVTAFPLLALLYISQLSIFTVHPIVQPADAELAVDEQNFSLEQREELQLSLNDHWITIQPAGWKASDDLSVYPQPRRIKLNRSAVFEAWWNGAQLRWSLIYNVYVNPKGAVDEVVVKALEHDFDPTFVKNPTPPLSSDELRQPLGPPRTTTRELIYEWHGAENITVPLRLPLGKYSISSRKKGCSDEPAVSIEVTGESTNVFATEEPCPNSAHVTR